MPPHAMACLFWPCREMLKTVGKQNQRAAQLLLFGPLKHFWPEFKKAILEISTLFGWAGILDKVGTNPELSA